MKLSLYPCLLKCVANLGSMQDTGCLGVVHWDDPEGWYGEGGGRVFRIGNTCTPVADSCCCMAKPIQYCKVISLQLNKFVLKKLKNQRKVFACLPFYHHTSGKLYPFLHSSVPAWSTLSQAAHSRQPRFPGAWPTLLLKWQGLDSITGSGGGKHSHGCYSQLSNLQFWLSSPWP